MARVISGMFLALFGLGLVLLGDLIAFLIFILVVILISLFEYFTILEKGRAPCLKYAGTILGVALGIVIYLENAPALIASLLTLVIIIFGLAFFLDKENPKLMALNTIFGIGYIAVTLSTFALIRKGTGGDLFVIMVVTANAFGDIFAFYTGRLIGKTPLAPKISPKKTVEGFFGGLAGSILATVVIMYLFIPDLGLIHALIIGTLIGLLGPLGDLVESSIKRKMGVKDSGWIIPGHGGMLDRVDSQMFSGASFYIYLKLVLAQ